MGNLSFRVTERGFDPEQVREYVGMIQDEYKKVYEENLRLAGENGRLQNQAAEEAPPGYDPAAIGKALLEVEKLAEKIVGEARREASGLLEAAKMDEKRLRERLRSIQAQVHASARGLSAIHDDIKKMSEHDENAGTSEPGVYGGARADGAPSGPSGAAGLDALLAGLSNPDSGIPPGDG
jgi:cell division septum initiation protein DivIVA